MEVIYDPEEISRIFHNYFSKLYSLSLNSPTATNLHSADIKKFLIACHLPSLPADVIASLNGPVTMEELEEVLKALPLGKATGPDSLTYLYYKTFASQLTPHILGLFNPSWVVFPFRHPCHIPA